MLKCRRQVGSVDSGAVNDLKHDGIVRHPSGALCNVDDAALLTHAADDNYRFIEERLRCPTIDPVATKDRNASWSLGQHSLLDFPLWADT